MEKNNNCIFCKIVKGEISNEKIYDDDNFFAIRDINPITKGHSLVISKKHFKTLLDMPSSLGNEMIEACKKVALDLIKEEKAEGFNLLMSNYESAGQIVPHVHMHILPRKKDDGIKTMVNLKKIKEITD